jgi:3-hydroxybutyryl-CoA dehydrogenase
MMSRLPNIAVLGAGRMGAGIAFVFTGSDHQVRLYEPDPAARDRASDRLREVAATLNRPHASDILISGDLNEVVRQADLIIEAAPENTAIKRALFDELGGAVGPDVMVGTNTSSLPIESFAQGFPNPGRLVYAHFWNPPFAIPLVEVAPGPDTDEQAIDTVAGWLKGAGMAPVSLRRAVPGLIGNRLQHALKREAIALVADGVCDAATIDDVVKLGFGARMAVLGPMEQSDLVGLDLTLAIHESLMPTLDRTAGAHPYLIEKVDRGELGMDAGVGFRTWTLSSAKAIRDRLDRWNTRTSQAEGDPEPLESESTP